MIQEVFSGFAHWKCIWRVKWMLIITAGIYLPVWSLALPHTKLSRLFCFNSQNLASQIAEGNHMTHLVMWQGNMSFGDMATIQSLWHSFWLSCLMISIFIPFIFFSTCLQHVGARSKRCVHEQGTILSSGGRWQSASSQYNYFYFPLTNRERKALK